VKIKVKYFNENLPKIEKIKQGDWIDLRASETIELKQFDFAKILLGVGMKLPEGYEANIVPRSSTFENFGILQTNSFAVIDELYCGNEDEWKLPVIAIRDTVINEGDRICQFRINKKMEEVEIETVFDLEEDSRGGFGTTGTK
jgi:dUTP pyrophosphatase